MRDLATPGSQGQAKCWMAHVDLRRSRLRPIMALVGARRILSPLVSKGYYDNSPFPLPPSEVTTLPRFAQTHLSKQEFSENSAAILVQLTEPI